MLGRMWRKGNLTLSFGPAIPLLSIYPRKWNKDLQKISAPSCSLQHCSPIEICKQLKRASMGEWIKKMWYVCVSVCISIFRFYYTSNTFSIHSMKVNIIRIVPNNNHNVLQNLENLSKSRKDFSSIIIEN